jgi:hypothetical protein
MKMMTNITELDGLRERLEGYAARRSVFGKNVQRFGCFCWWQWDNLVRG